MYNIYGVFFLLCDVADEEEDPAGPAAGAGCFHSFPPLLLRQWPLGQTGQARCVSTLTDECWGQKVQHSLRPQPHLMRIKENGCQRA